MSESLHNKETGQSRGFGFVEMGSQEEAEMAKQRLLDTAVEGSKIVIAEAWENHDKGK